MREHRDRENLRLLDLAARMGCSSAFLSAIETGRKPPPHDFVARASRALQLSDFDRVDLEIAESLTRKEVSVRHLNLDDQELVAAFARRVERLSPADRVALRKRISLKSKAGDSPFERKTRGLVVPPRSERALRTLAEKIRGTFVDDNEVMVPIVDLVEFKMWRLYDGFHIDVRPRDEMGDDEGRVLLGQDALVLRQDVYEAACRDDGRSRFTICHELAHWLLHREIPVARTRSADVPIYQDSEWQADVFAGALMMSERHAAGFVGAHDAAGQCGMSVQAARIQLEKYGKRGVTPK